jgi:hypothetical protein
MITEESENISKGSESVMRLLDIDGDGLQDIVFGAATAADLAAISNADEDESLRVFCNATGLIIFIIGYTNAKKDVYDIKHMSLI